MTSLTIEDAESSFLKGKADFEGWLNEFQMRWYLPQILDMLGVMVDNIPVESRLIAPSETAIMEMILNKARGGKNASQRKGQV